MIKDILVLRAMYAYDYLEPVKFYGSLAGGPFDVPQDFLIIAKEYREFIDTLYRDFKYTCVDVSVDKASCAYLLRSLTSAVLDLGVRSSACVQTDSSKESVVVRNFYPRLLRILAGYPQYFPLVDEFLMTIFTGVVYYLDDTIPDAKVFLRKARAVAEYCLAGNNSYQEVFFQHIDTLFEDCVSDTSDSDVVKAFFAKYPEIIKSINKTCQSYVWYYGESYLWNYYNKEREYSILIDKVYNACEFVHTLPRNYVAYFCYAELVKHDTYFWSGYIGNHIIDYTAWKSGTYSHVLCAQCKRCIRAFLTDVVY